MVSPLMAAVAAISVHAAPATPPHVHATPPPTPVTISAPAVAPAPPPAPMDAPVTMYDSAQASNLPASAGFVATYSNGSYAASPSSIPGHPNTVWIDVNGSNPNANALDIEPGDASPSQAAAWVHANKNPVVILYSSVSTWDAVKQSVSTLSPQDQSRVRYWIADPTGVPHLLPGSAATQYAFQSNVDISMVRGDFAHN
jgi:hypothetical protein